MLPKNSSMLLSQANQAHMGMIKFMRTGKIFIEDEDGQPGDELEVARQARTGLFMIRIDNLDPVAFASFMKEDSDPHLIEPLWDQLREQSDSEGEEEWTTVQTDHSILIDNL